MTRSAGFRAILARMVKVQHQLTLSEDTIQKIAEGAEVVPARKPRKRAGSGERARASRKKHYEIEDRLFSKVHTEVYEKALELASGNWKRLLVVDNETIIVKNNEVH